MGWKLSEAVGVSAIAALGCDGREVALMEGTGHSMGSHRHFEIYPAAKGGANLLAYVGKQHMTC